MEENNGYFHGRKAVLATKHKKEEVIAPLLKEKVGLDVFVPDAFDSDLFGTFTRDVKRRDDQLETARKKARAAMNQTGIDIGIASEGSFGNHPDSPFLPYNMEYVVLIDDRNNLEIVGSYGTSKTNMSGRSVRSVEEALDVAQVFGFPENGVIVRKGPKSNRHIYKEAHDVQQLREVVQKVLSKPLSKGVAYVETDMRAHKNSLRMMAIEQATIDLVEKMMSLCPVCHLPGFAKVSVASWVPCEGCGTDSKRPKEYLFRCSACHHEEIKTDPTAPQREDQMYCLVCNP